ncbi:MAG: CDP-glycerol glycerophosphotransferase family protein [Gemmatimonadota bacterium]
MKLAESSGTAIGAGQPGRLQKPTLGLVLSNGWSLKNLLHSGVMGRLEQHFELLAWITTSHTALVRTLASQCGVHDAQWESCVNFDENRLQKFNRQIEQSLFLGHVNATTEHIRLRSRRIQRATADRIVGKVLGSVGRSKAGPKILEVASSIRRRLGYRPFYRERFETEPPDLIVVGNPVDYREDPIVYEAARFGIPVAAMVASWDNLSSKGVIHRGYDRVLVWNDSMRDEVLEYYRNYRRDQVIPVGIPRFDVYQRPLPEHFSRRPFFERLGLDPSKRLMLFANTATSLIPDQPQIIRHLCEALREGALSRDTQLLIRPHPRDPYELYAPFESFDRVRVWQPGLSADPYNWAPEVDDDLILAAMLKHAAVSLNPFSTMTLDAAACDVPIVSVAYDGDHPKPYFDSVLSAYDFSHMVPVMRFGATTLCKSRTEMIAAVNAYLDNPSLHRAERQSLAREYCRIGSVTAADRLLKVLLTWAIDSGVLAERGCAGAV